MIRARIAILASALAGVAGATLAQGVPTGSISGRVSDPDSLSLPGVTVSVSSPALQGVRRVTTSANGDYVVPFLPVGDYAVSFEIQGFQTLKREVRVAMAETVPLSVKLALASVSETVSVTAASPLEFTQTSAIASTIKSDLVERLPMGRTVTDAALLVPGVSISPTTGGLAVSGALTYENIFLVNGVVVNENLRGQPLSLFIEDAIEETKVTIGNASAEFGRFNGGVVNTVTKSGGNNFSGSFRTSFRNDAWRSLTPFPGDQTIDKVTPSYEGTFGGPILKDKLWFFGAARYQSDTENRTMKYTGINYVRSYPEQRYEGKLTYALTNDHNLKLAYQRIDARDNNRAFPNTAAVIDPGALSSRDEPQRLLSVNYTGILSPRLFVEGQFSQRRLTYVGSGAQTTDLIEGTPIWDRTKSNSRYNAPFACAVCGEDLPNKERRNNWDAFGKVSYFLSTGKGSHNVVAGFDTFQEQRKGDNWQSGSSYRVESNSPIIIRNETVYPVLLTGSNSRTGTAFLQYMPLGAPSKGNAIRTYSTFVNDVWRLDDRLTFNLGLRYDKNDTQDQSEKKVGDAGAFSPRLSVTWKLGGKSNWVANAGVARYVSAFTTAVADASSIAGRTNTFRWVYLGPSINADPNAANLLDSHAALRVLFDWFKSVGGNSYPLLLTSTILGVTSQVDPQVRSTSSDEWSGGVSRTLGGGKGSIRVDYLHRVYHDFYSDRIDMTTGKATTSSGQADITFVTNNDDNVNRTYEGLNTQLSYHFGPELQVGGNYTLSWVRGNFTGETSDSGPDRAAVESYPEYRAESWSYPTGYMPQDQRHRVRLWASYTLPWAKRLGDIGIGMIQRSLSGTHFSPQGSVDSRPYVTNPGYATPPSTVPYYFGDRGAYTTDTLYSTNLSLLWRRKLPGFGKRAELFFRGIVNNVFNNSARTSLDSSIFTNVNDRTLAVFNPFTTKPVEGVNWTKGPSFGQVTGVTDYQSPRDLSFSVGFRF